MQTLQRGVDIRPFAEADYPRITELNNLNYPEFTKDVDHRRFHDERFRERGHLARWVAEADGTIVGFGEYHHNVGTFHPRKFALDLLVHPEWHGRGVGGRLYDIVMEDMRRFDPIGVDAWSREDLTWRVGFFARRGFVEDMRVWVSELDLEKFDSTQWAERAPRLDQHMRIRTLSDLGVDDPTVQHKLYDFWHEVRVDVPMPPGEVRVETSFDEFWRWTSGPGFLPDGFFVALDGDEYVGSTALWSAPEPDRLRTGLTAVRRSHRRRGIALALKIRALEFAKSGGYRYVLTENESNNRGMLAINEALGFEKYPAWVHFVKTIVAPG